ncbi:NAD(P)-binding protein [Neoconidiobolus thromboides FSU 785]|nr:NAD(P)-binding protein [Neoconidiobolus thromboides FSU 785]
MERLVCIITGGNSGLGYHYAQRLIHFNYQIIIASRNKQRGEEAVEEIKKTSGGKDNIEFMSLDLSDKDSIYKFSDQFKSKYKRLDILFNNAGAYYRNDAEVNNEGIDLTLSCNHYGHFLLTHLLSDLLKDTKNSRIVNTSSSLHTKVTDDQDLLDLNPTQHGVPSSFIYPMSKRLSLLTYTYLKNNVLKDDIQLINLCPGFVPNTNLAKDVNFITKFILNKIFPLFPFASTMEQGVNRMLISSTSNLLPLGPPPNENSTLFYSKEKFDWVEFNSDKIKEAYEHSLKIVGLEK